MKTTTVITLTLRVVIITKNLSIAHLFHSHLTCEYVSTVITLTLRVVIIWIVCHASISSSSALAEDKAASPASIISLHDLAMCHYYFLVDDVDSLGVSPNFHGGFEWATTAFVHGGASEAHIIIHRLHDLLLQDLK